MAVYIANSVAARVHAYRVLSRTTPFHPAWVAHMLATGRLERFSRGLCFRGSSGLEYCAAYGEWLVYTDDDRLLVLEDESFRALYGAAVSLADAERARETLQQICDPPQLVQQDAAEPFARQPRRLYLPEE